MSLEKKDVEITLKDILIIFVAYMIWPISLAIVIVSAVDEFQDIVIIKIKRKKEEDTK